MSPRTASSAPVTLVRLDAGADAPAYRQICDSLREAIVSGRLAPGAHLPSTRLLAVELGVSRNTVNGALAHLRAEGYVVARARAGTFVNHRLDAEGLMPPRGRTAGGTLRGRASEGPPGRDVRLSSRSRMLARLPLAAGRSVVQPSRPFQTGVPALDAFPWKLWARLVSSRTRRSGSLLSAYGEVLGYAPLREAIARYVAAARGARCAAAQVIVTAGAQQGLDLVARVLVDPGDTVWVEDPGYPAARGVFAGAGARLVPVGLDGEGLLVPDGGRAVPSPRLVYVTPSRQFPTGVTMSAARRLQLLHWADRADAWIVEDDYDSEFRYASRPLNCLQGLDERERVIYVGTFSKTVFPGLRLGYLIVPPPLVGAFSDARAVADRQPPGIEQAVLAEFIAAGHLTRHVRRMRNLYEERRDALLRAAHEWLGDRLAFGDTAAGMLAVAWLPPRVSDQRVSERALLAGVEVSPLSRYAIRPVRRGGLLLGYAGFPPEALRDAVRRLSQVLDAAGRRP